jgi:hypothetical protein
MMGLEEASGHFLDAYQAATGRRVENLELWELVAAAASCRTRQLGFRTGTSLGIPGASQTP